MKEKTLVCDLCGTEYSASDDTFFDGKHLCPHCRISRTIRCRCCDERIWRTDAIDGDLCENCYETHYTRCTSCDCVIHNDDAYYMSDDTMGEYPYCESCYREQTENRYIHDYDYKPEPIFYHTSDDDDLYMGIELEIDMGGESDEYAEQIHGIANRDNNHLYIKHDGSLDMGMELVSHPMTYEYHKNVMPWRDILRKAVSLGYRSHTPGTCGLHIHVDRQAFGVLRDEQDVEIARIVYFYEKFWKEILRFSRRTEYQANRWAARYGGGLNSCKDSLDTAKKSGLGRYTAVNLENYDTVEFRIFRGTLRYDTFIATLQFTHYLCKLAINSDDKKFHSMSWLDFVSSIDEDKYPELVNYLKLRRLYINEPVEEMEEI